MTITMTVVALLADVDGGGHEVGHKSDDSVEMAIWCRSVAGSLV